MLVVGIGIGAIIYQHSTTITFTIQEGQVWFYDPGTAPIGFTITLSDMHPTNASLGHTLTITGVMGLDQHIWGYDLFYIVSEYAVDVFLTFSAVAISVDNEWSQVYFTLVGHITWANDGSVTLTELNTSGFSSSVLINATLPISCYKVTVNPDDTLVVGDSLELNFAISYSEPGT